MLNHMVMHIYICKYKYTPPPLGKQEEDSQAKQEQEQEQEKVGTETATAIATATEEGPAAAVPVPVPVPTELAARLRAQRAFVLKLPTADMEEARQAVAYAQARGRPLLLQGLLAAEVKGFSAEQLLLVPADVKVVSDDKTGIGNQALREWGQPPKRRATLRADHPNWGKIASIMSEKGAQARLWKRFMEGDMAAFRAATGHTALAAFGDAVFGGLEPQSSNLIVTGNAAPSAEGRSYELRSDAHQDMHDNLMVVASGSKIWALASLTEAQVAKGRKRKGRLTSSFALDAVDRTRNKTAEEHEVAAAFETVYMGPGDVLFNPAMVWHQVNSEPRTLAYSLMFPLPGDLDEVREQAALRQRRAEAELLAGVGGEAAAAAAAGSPKKHCGMV
jgi:hypothetical protein